MLQGVGAALFMSAGRTVFQEQAPPEQRGRVLSVYMLGFMGAARSAGAGGASSSASARPGWRWHSSSASACASHRAAASTAPHPGRSRRGRRCARSSASRATGTCSPPSACTRSPSRPPRCGTRPSSRACTASGRRDRDHARLLARPATRATAAALNLLVLTLVGAGLGPTLVGALNDALQGAFGAEAIRWSLALVAATSLWSGTHALLGARTLRTDLAAVAGDEWFGPTRPSKRA